MTRDVEEGAGPGRCPARHGAQRTADCVNHTCRSPSTPPRRKFSGAHRIRRAAVRRPSAARGARQLPHVGGREGGLRGARRVRRPGAPSTRWCGRVGITWARRSRREIRAAVPPPRQPLSPTGRCAVRTVVRGPSDAPNASPVCGRGAGVTRSRRSGRRAEGEHPWGTAGMSSRN